MTSPSSGLNRGRVWMPDTGEHRAVPDSRAMSYSRAELTTLVMPQMQNVLGDLFGGELMSLVDQAAAVAAIRHAGGPAVTASIDRVDFREPIHLGELVICSATVDFVGNSSMDITVEVYAEAVHTGERRHTHTAHVVFVAIDEQGRPHRVPRLRPETLEERERYERAREHRERAKRAREG
ncbi:MAG TPA: acyl-CoA thioesterase [Gemmatimonadales bacterium]|nr:acyl-CoA thioesterase [Gemmatimonadales bacterium]